MKPLLASLSVIALSLGLAGCRSEKPAAAGPAAESTSAPIQLENALAGVPSQFLEEHADSPVHWQRWSPQVRKQAVEGKRMILAMIGSSRFPGCHETLDAIDENPDLVELINRNFVPVLVDLDLARETGLFAFALSPETGKPVAFPFLLVLSPEGSPVSWHPIHYSDDESVINFIDNSVSILVRMWNDSPNYVTDNSRNSLESRRGALPPADPEIESRDELVEGILKISRDLLNRFDPNQGSYDGAGGLLPIGLIDCLGQLSTSEVIPAAVRERCAETATGLADQLLASAMFDPLDSGVYASRLGPTWNLPLFIRDGSTQARTAAVLARLHQATGSLQHLGAAIGLVRFAEEHFQTDDGLFALAAMPSPDPSFEWLWKLETIASILDPEELEVWTSLSDLRELGNIPVEADPGRRYLHYNSLAMRKSVEEVAADTGVEPAEVRARIESGRCKLLAARQERAAVPRGEALPSATTSFRMVSVYAHLHAASGDPTFLDKAVKLAGTARESFSDSRFLNERPGGGPDSISDARAFTYVVAANASLDLAAVTLDDSWNLWAQDLLTLLGEHFIGDDGRLTEVRSAVEVIDLDLEDRLMVFDDSTAGLVRLAVSRLESLGYPVPPALHPWRDSVPLGAGNMPVIITDSLLAISRDLSRHSLRVGPQAEAALVDRVRRLPVYRFDRRRDEALGATIEMTRPDDSRVRLESVDAIRELGAPAAIKR